MRADDFLELDAPKTQSADAFLDAESFLDEGLDTPEPDTRDLIGLADVARFDRRGPEPGTIRQPRTDDEPQFGDYLGATPGMIAEGLGGAVGGTVEGFGLIADRAQRVTADNKVTIALDNLRKAGENLARAQEFPEYRNREQIIGKAQEEFEQRQQQLHEATVALAEQKPSEAAQFLRELGVDIQELGRSMGPGDDLQGVYRDLTTGLGSMLAYYGPGLVAGAVTRGSGLASLGTAAAMAGPAGVSEQYARAKQSGLSEDEALAVAMKGIPGGVVQVAPIAALIRPLPAEIQGKAIGQLYGVLRAAGSEFVAENAGAIMQNLVEQSYNPEKGTWDDTPYQGLIAGGSSAILQTAIQLVTKGRGMNASGTQTGRVQEAQPGTEQSGVVEPEQAAPDTEQPEPATETGDWTDALLAEEFLDAPVQPEVAQQGIDATPEEGFGLNPFEQAPAQPEAAQTEQVEQAPVEPEGLTERGTGVFRVPVDQIQVDPEQYQFRSRVNEQGVDQRLSGVEQWDDNRAGSVLLHRRADGSLFVADGHHRVDLARRLNQGEINARVIDEADGFDVSDARVEAAMNNIADGKAEPLDVAKVFRDSGIPVDQVRRRYDLPNNQVARDGEALAKLTDNVFGLVSSGQLSEKDGAAIGNAFTESGQQEAAAGTFQRIEPSTDYQRQLLINELRAAEFAETQGEQGGLFGDDAQEISLMQQRLQVLDALRQRLNSDKRLFKSLNDNADRASEAGNRIATEANESITQESARTLDLIGRVTTTPGLNEMVNRAARRVYDGETRAKVVNDLKQELMAYERGQTQPDSGRPSPTQSSQSADESGSERRAGERVPEQDAREADQGGQPESGQQEVTPALDLETQTEEQLAEQARAREEAQQAEARQKREEEQRATADEQVGSFTLTGSDRTADVAMAAGQDDMFVAGQTAQKVEQAAAEVDQSPTESQIEAGNYKKGHVTVQGLDITLENPRGSTRSGTDPDGNDWSVTMAHHYGYLKRTEGADGEHVDVFVGPDLGSDNVFVIDQVNPDGNFDEHKVLLGFKNQLQARAGYKDNYTKDWKVGPITRMTMDEFKAWLAEGDLTKPLKLEAAQAEPGVTWKKDGKRVWRADDGQIITDESFTTGGVRTNFFPVYASKADRGAGNNYTSGESLVEAKAKARSRPARQSESTPASERKAAQIAGEMTEAEILAEIDSLSAIADERMAKAVATNAESALPAPIEYLDAQESARFADLKAALPSDTERRAQARAQVERRAQDRKLKTRTATQRRQEAIEAWLGDAAKGDRITFSGDVGYAKAGREYTVGRVDGGGVEVSSDNGSTVISHAEIEGAKRKGISVVKVDAKQEKPNQPAAPIEDFGEKIEGARKDYASKLAAAKEKDVAAVPLSESWPEPDYQKLLDSGADPEAVGFAHALRDEVPPKPRKGWKLKGWARQVEAFRDVAEKAISGDITMAMVRGKAGEQQFKAVDAYVVNRADLYAEVGHSKSLKGLRFYNGHFTIFEGKKGSFDKWIIERVTGASNFGNMPRQLAAADTKEQAIKQFRKVYESLDAKGAEPKNTRFDIYTSRYDRNDVFIGKKIGKDVVRIKEGFDSVKEAREYLSDKQDVLERILAKMKHIPSHRKESNAPRVGKDHRNGGDVTPEAFSEAFGFRGVQFGNYVEQGRRQSDLNDAYDGLMDLAGILNIPAKALSLNGELGLAFGARGKGGKNAPKAHYEGSNIVINLTKKDGAGSLAHEWWHSLDNYFGRERGGKPTGQFATDGSPDAAVRPEVAEAFRNIRRTVNRIGLRERSKKLDRVRTKAYWATDIEMSARAFESYVIERLKDQNASNDYLANIVSEEYWKASEALGMQDSDSYPYPEAAEVPEIRAAYDNLFEVIETREGDDGNVALFSREGDYRRTPDTQIESLTAEEARTIANGLMKGWKGRPGVTVADSISAFPARLRQAIREAGAESDMRAVFWNQHVYVLAPRIPSRAALEEVILHEVVGHYGLRKMLGGELKPLLDRVYRDLGDSARARVIKRVYFANNFDATNTEHRLTVAEELLAHLAESGKHQHRTLWQRIVTAIRDGLRRLGFTIRMTENDLLKILEGAQRTVEQGGFSRPSDTDINFKRIILDLSDSMLTKDGDAVRLTNPVTLRDGSRLSGFTDPQTQEVLFGYDQNGEQFTMRRDQVNPDDISSSRDSNRTADMLRDGLLQMARAESANPDIRFSRLDEEGGRELRERQVKFWDGFATQPLDRMFRALFDVTGMVDSHGRLKKGVEVTRGAERILKEWRPNPNGHFAWVDTVLETARHGLLDRYKLTDDYKMTWRQAEAYGRNLDMQAMDILKTLEDRGVSGVEAAVLQKVLTGESVGDHQMQAVAAPIRRAIDDLGQAAVEYGIITREQFERNRGEYLHRSYLRHESEFTGLGKWIHKQQRNQNRKIKGDTAKGRGIEISVPTSKLMQHVPVGWYGIRKQGQKPDMQALNGQKFVVLENPGVIADRSGTLEGVETAEQPRTTETVYWPASQPVPAKYEAWRKRGTFEVRRSKKDKVVLWRDYTKAEREHMGEILDARFNIAKTFQLLSRDLAMGKFFHDVSLNPEWFTREKPVSDSILSAREANSLHTLSKADWVEVPDTTVSGSAGTRQWGALAGGWVRAEIWRDLNELDKMHNPGMWRKVLTQWKLNKTARSPVVHMNNVMSNLVLMDLADVRVTDLVKGIQSYRARDEHWRAAQEYGAFEGTFINEEIRKQVLDPILDELTKQNLASATDADGAVQSLSRMAYTMWSNIKKLDNAMTQFYQVEDELFRMATYMRRLDLGDTPIDAARTAREQFLDYDIRAPWVNAARRTVLPFISYTYRAVPVVAQSIIHRPWKLAKYFTLAYLANSLSYLLAPGDEDEERRTMRDDQQGMTWIGTPRMLRMPWHDEHGNPVFMDIRRWIPAGDVFDMNQGNSALPVPAPVQFGGPLMLAFEFALNKQAFTGEEIVNRDTDTALEATGKTADWLYKSWMPSGAYIPGSFYWDRFWTAQDGGRDILGRPYSVPQALLSSIGIKVQPHDVRLGYEFRSRDLAAEARMITADVRRARSDLDRNIITQGEYLKITARAKRKMERLKERQDRLQGRD